VYLSVRRKDKRDEMDEIVDQDQAEKIGGLEQGDDAKSEAKMAETAINIDQHANTIPEWEKQNFGAEIIGYDAETLQKIAGPALDTLLEARNIRDHYAEKYPDQVYRGMDENDISDARDSFAAGVVLYSLVSGNSINKSDNKDPFFKYPDGTIWMSSLSRDHDWRGKRLEDGVLNRSDLNSGEGRMFRSLQSISIDRLASAHPKSRLVLPGPEGNRPRFNAIELIEQIQIAELPYDKEDEIIKRRILGDMAKDFVQATFDIRKLEKSEDAIFIVKNLAEKYGVQPESFIEKQE